MPSGLSLNNAKRTKSKPMRPFLTMGYAKSKLKSALIS